MYNIGMLGDFDRDVFASDFAATLFVWYTFFVVIVNLNVLIAIVSDSYGARCVSCFAVCVALFELWRARAQTTRWSGRASSSCARGSSSPRNSSKTLRVVT